MTLFKHLCWFCGFRSRAVCFVEGDYQCDDRRACLERRYVRKPWERPE